MRIELGRTAVAVIAASLLSAGAAGAQTVQNGDFELGTLADWTASGAVEVGTEGGYGPCCGFTTSHPGNHVAVLGGGFGTGTEVLSQSFATTAGATYYVHYDFAFIGGGNNNSLDVSIAGVTHSFVGNGSPDIDASYLHDTLSFVGTGGVETLSFLVHDGPTDSTDTIVDNVSAGIPEPASWALMIAGFGLAGAALRRRRAIAA